MLKLYESIPGINVVSLRSGGPIARIHSAIINPNNLYIEGWRVEDNRSKESLILLSNDIRDIIPQGFAVNDHEVLSTQHELVRLKDVLDLKFNLVGLKVTSESGKKYGKINDFAFDSSSFFVQKLYAAQPLVKNPGGGTLSIDRTQIVEVTDKRIVIEDPLEAIGSRAPSAGLLG